MCDVSPRLVHSTLGNSGLVPLPNTARWCSFKKNIFQRLKSFFWLVGRSCNASIRSRGENFSACEKVFFFAYFFGHSIWLRAREHCTSVPWLCECWCCHTWECFKSPDTPFGTILDQYALQDGLHPSCYREHPQRSTGNIPNGVSGDLKHSQV